MIFDRYGYGLVSGFYDELAAFYSRGRIGATKQSQLQYLKPADRVLYPGVGRGEDAIQAARGGAAKLHRNGPCRRNGHRAWREILEP